MPDSYRFIAGEECSDVWTEETVYLQIAKNIIKYAQFFIKWYKSVYIRKEISLCLEQNVTRKEIFPFCSAIFVSDRPISLLMSVVFSSDQKMHDFYEEIQNWQEI